MDDFNQDTKIVGGNKILITKSNYNSVISGTVVQKSNSKIVGLLYISGQDKLVLYKGNDTQNINVINTDDLTVDNYSYINMDLGLLGFATTINNVESELINIINLLDDIYFIEGSPKRVVIDNLLKSIKIPDSIKSKSTPIQPAPKLLAAINTRITKANQQPENKVVVASGNNNAFVQLSQSTELVAYSNTVDADMSASTILIDVLKNYKGNNIQLSLEGIPESFDEHRSGFPILNIENTTKIGDTLITSEDMYKYQDEVKRILIEAANKLPIRSRQNIIDIINKFLKHGEKSEATKKDLLSAIKSCNDVDILAEITSDILNKVLKQTQEEKESLNQRVSENIRKLNNIIDESLKETINTLPDGNQDVAFTHYRESITKLNEPNANATTIAGNVGITDQADIDTINEAIKNPDNVNNVQGAVHLINAATTAKLTLPDDLKKQIQERLNNYEATVVAGLMSISTSAIAVKKIEEIQKQINIKFTLILNKIEDTLYISDIDVLLTNLQGDIPAGSTTINKTTLKVGGTGNSISGTVSVITNIGDMVTDIIEPLTNNDAFNKIKRVYNTDEKTNAPTTIEGSVNQLTIEYDLFLKQDKLSMLFKPLTMKNDYVKMSTPSLINKQISKDVIKNKIVFKSEEPSVNMYQGLKTAYLGESDDSTKTSLKSRVDRKAEQNKRNIPLPVNDVLRKQNEDNKEYKSMVDIDGGRRRTRRRSSRKTKRTRNHKQKTQRRRKYRKTSR
jgi:hypothetical protein